MGQCQHLTSSPLYGLPCPGYIKDGVCGPGLSCIDKKCQICNERYNFILPSYSGKMCFIL